MNTAYSFRNILTILLLLFTISACSSTKILEEDNFTPAVANAEAIVSKLPDYSDSLSTLKGKGRAIVSEPGSTDRVTVNFISNREKSLVTVKNAVGIEGGELLTDGDSLLIYNKIDKFARKVSVREKSLNNINNLASLNILTLLNFTVNNEEDVQTMLESKKHYLVMLESGTRLFIDKETYTVHQVQQPSSSALPYSKIIYEAYGRINGFRLPRKITIFSSDAKSRVTLLIQSLEANPELNEPTIELPDNITIYDQ